MKPNFYRLLLVFINLLTSIYIISCATNGAKWSPEYDGVDPRLQKYVDEYKKLAAIQGIKFKKNVTIGFKKINSDIVVGLCTYGNKWREIDIDINYWNSITSISKVVLMYHEASHCYCGRVHDYDDNKLYPEAKDTRNMKQKSGMYDDSCPLSLLYPIVVSDDCFKTHYNNYIKEMFLRCKPF